MFNFMNFDDRIVVSDPYGIEQIETLTGSGALDEDGTLDIDGDYIIIGRGTSGAGAEGEASIYFWNGTTWSEQQVIAATGGSNGDYFGESAAIDGDTCIVGAPGEDGAGSQRGSAYVFTRSGSTWTQQQQLTASDAADFDFFGTQVDISGDTCIVGTQSAEAAYVFTRSGSTWTQQQILTASDAASDQFGWQVAIDGDNCIVGAWLNDDVQNNAGSAYVFTRSGSTWTEQQKLLASSPLTNGNFGMSVDIEADWCVVSQGYNVGSGDVTFFTRSGSTWTEQQILTASDASLLDRFGGSICLDGNTLIIGAPGEDGAGSDRGAAYVFTYSGSTWTEQQKITASDAVNGDKLGESVAISGINCVVGSSSTKQYIYASTTTTY